MKEGKNFERELPVGYRQVYHLDAGSFRTGLILNLVSVAVMLLVMASAGVAVWRGGGFDMPQLLTQLVGWLALAASLLLYIPLHELVHGAAYRLLTGEKLTFGISWSCAFCGVPTIYTYRRTALWALVSPLALFTLLLIPVMLLLYTVSPWFFLLSALLFGIHLGGCSGDIYVTLLFLFKFRDRRVLMRDTGPEQFFYLPEAQ